MKDLSRRLPAWAAPFLLRWRMLVLFGAGTALLAGLVSLLLPKTYAAEATVRLGLKRSSFSLFSEYFGPAVVDPVHSQIELFESRSVARKAVEGSGLNVTVTPSGDGVVVETLSVTRALPLGDYRLYVDEQGLTRLEDDQGTALASAEPGKALYWNGLYVGVTWGEQGKADVMLSVGDYDDALGEALGRVKVYPRGKTDLVSVRAFSSDPERAALLANALSNAYVEMVLIEGQEDARAARLFIDEQLSRVSSRLSQSEDSLRAFKERSGVVLLDEAAKAIVGQLSMLEKERSEALASMQQNGIGAASLRKQLESEGSYQGYRDLASEPELSSNPLIKRLKGELVLLEARRESLLVELTENHPQVVAMTKRMTSTRQQLEKAVGLALGAAPAGDDQVVQRLYSELITKEAATVALGGRADALGEMITEKEKELATLPAKEQEMAALSRDVEAARAVYGMLVTKLEETKILEVQQVGDAKIIDRALPRSSPVSPVIPTNAFLGLLFGLASAAGFILATGGAAERVTSDEEAEYIFGARTLARIPLLSEEEAGMDYEFHWYSTLTTNLKFIDVDRPPAVVALTSPQPRDGKSTVACNLARSLSGRGQSVLLVDGDLHKPAIGALTGLSGGMGLSGVLSGELELEQAVSSPRAFPSLDVLTSGVLPADPGALLSSEAFETLIAEARAHYDWVIVDCPPVNPVGGDVLEISRAVDGLVMVVMEGQTHRREAQSAARFLRSSMAKLLGICMNGVATDSYGYYGRADEKGGAAGLFTNLKRLVAYGPRPARK